MSLSCNPPKQKRLRKLIFSPTKGYVDGHNGEVEWTADKSKAWQMSAEYAESRFAIWNIAAIAPDAKIVPLVGA